jgi:hypothetical protein
LMTAKQRVDYIPWMWDADGDKDVENCVDGTKTNYIVCGGIPGTRPAWTEIEGSFTGATNLIISHLPLDEFLPLNTSIFIDHSVTATGATECGGGYTQTADFGAIPLTAALAGTMTGRTLRALQGRRLNLVVRMTDAGSGLLMRWGVQMGGGRGYYSSDYKAIAADGTFRPFLLEPIYIPLPPRTANGIDYINNPDLSLDFTRTSGAAAASRIDYAAIMAEPTLYLILVTNAFILNSSRTCICLDTSAARIHARPGTIYGSGSIDLVPDKYNVISTISGTLATSSAVATVLTYNTITVRPRWGQA